MTANGMRGASTSLSSTTPRICRNTSTFLCRSDMRTIVAALEMSSWTLTPASSRLSATTALRTTRPLRTRCSFMAHPLKHAQSSARRFGGKPEDYLPIHSWFDESKAFLADFRHSALRHHTEGIFLLEKLF